MESKFIPTLQAGNGYTYLKLKGILDEDNLLANLLSQIQGRLLLIDMAEIERINSCGVRDWVNWLNQIQALGITVILLRCSPVVVAQANMVANFAADAFIHSFYAPYAHPDTREEQSVLLFTEDIRQNQPIRAPKIFNENGEELEFDEFEESYFAFISDSRIMNYQVPSDIQSVIQFFLPESASHQPVISQKSQASSVSQVPQGRPMGGYGSQGMSNAYGMQDMQGGGLMSGNHNVYGAQGGYGSQGMQGGLMSGNHNVYGAQGMQSGVMGAGNGYGPQGMQSGVMGIANGYGPQGMQSGVMGAANGYGPQGGYGSQGMQGGYGAPNAYGNNGYPGMMGGMNSQAGRAMQPGYGPQGYGGMGQNGMPMPVAAMPMRHEQPPIPSSSGYQQIPSSQPNPQRNMPQQPMNAPMPPAASMAQQMPPAASMAQQMPPASSMAQQMPMDEPRPAPQPVSSLAMQSMARKAPMVVAPVPDSEPDMSGPETRILEQFDQNNPSVQAYNNEVELKAARDKRQRMLLGVIACSVVLLIIVIVIILVIKIRSTMG